MTPPTVLDRAVVLGGGIAGLLAAQVLADAGVAVTILDRDDLAAAQERRRGIPQGRHVHALLARAVDVLEALLPGLTEALVADGAQLGDALADARLRLSGHDLRRTTSGLPLLSTTRGLLERHVRDRVLAHPAVEVAPPCDVVGFTATADGATVTGVRRMRRAAGSADEVCEADLVVDATGRASRTPDWLKAIGRRPPPEERVGVDLGYATRGYLPAPDVAGGVIGVVVAPTATAPRGGAVARVEGGRLLLTLMGMAGDHPPVDPAGFDAFARTVPGLGEVVDGADPLGRPVPFRFAAAVRRRYERADPPEGLLVVGDSLCSLNPIYGQGMTVAAVEALVLRDALRRGTSSACGRLQRAVASVVDGPWKMTTGGDLAFDGVPGRPSPVARALGAYVARVHAAAAVDADVGRAFLRVSGLVDPPAALLRPRTALRVLRRSAAGRGRAAPPPPRAPHVPAVARRGRR